MIISATDPATRQRKITLAHLDRMAAALTVFLAPMNYLRLDQIYVTASDGAALLCLFLLVLRDGLPRRPFGPATEIWLMGYILLCAGLLGSSIVQGVKRRPGYQETETILMRSKTGSVRRMIYRNPLR